MNRLAAACRLLLLSPLIFANPERAAAQDDPIYRLPAGTRIHLKMDVELSSRFAGVNDTFLATVSRPVTRREVTVLPIGTVIEGRVTAAEHASAAAQNGKLEVVFESIRFSDTSRRSIEGSLVAKLGKPSSPGPGVLAVLGGTAAGALIGAITGTPAGTVVGAGVGAGAGAAVALARRGKEARIGKGEEFEIVLKKDVVLPVMDY